MLQLPVSAGRLAVGPLASKPPKGSRGRWGMRLGPFASAFAGEKIALIQRALKLYQHSLLSIEF